MLIDYYPRIIQQIQEMKEICKAEQPEFNAVSKEADRLLENRFISTSDEYGVARFERELGIVPYKYDSIDLRKLRIQLRLNNKKNYSYHDLLNSLDTCCGVGNYDIEVDFQKDFIDINVYNDSLDLRILDSFLEKTLPLNIVFDIHATAIDRRYVKIGTVWQDDEAFSLKEAGL